MTLVPRCQWPTPTAARHGRLLCIFCLILSGLRMVPVAGVLMPLAFLWFVVVLLIVGMGGSLLPVACCPVCPRTILPSLVWISSRLMQMLLWCHHKTLTCSVRRVQTTAHKTNPILVVEKDFCLSVRGRRAQVFIYSFYTPVQGKWAEKNRTAFFELLCYIVSIRIVTL